LVEEKKKIDRIYRIWSGRRGEKKGMAFPAVYPIPASGRKKIKIPITIL
jgi:hypothetical protein